MSWIRVLATLMLASLVTFSAAAQQPVADGQQPSPAADEDQKAGRPLSSEEQSELAKATGRKKKFDTWEEFLADWLTPIPVPKKGIIRVGENRCYPHVAVAFKMEIVREDEDTVWVRGLPPEDPESPIYPIWRRFELYEMGMLAHKEALAQPGAIYFLDYQAEIVPPPFAEALKFERAAKNLPDVGRWQMSFSVTDMNEDGIVDLVFPPQRKAIPPLPAIFLGDGKGGFAFWRNLSWPRTVPLDYGGVAVADFDGDGHQDIAIANHFKPQYVIYGAGNGVFDRVDRLPSPDPRVSSRAVTTADFNGDGRPDLAFLAEIDYDVRSSARIDDAATLWVVENAGGSWRLKTTGLPTNVIGDVLQASDVNGDGRPDLVLASNTVDWRRLVYLNMEGGEWEAAQHRGSLSAAYHYGVAPVGDELFSTFVQFKMVNKKTEVRNGIIRYAVLPPDAEPIMGEPVTWDRERGNVFFRLASGDLNGDGLADLVASRKGGGLEVYLQTSLGDFEFERSSRTFDGIGRAFDIKVVDLDGDGLDDIIAGCTPQKEKPGGIYVWLSRPAG